MINFAIGNQKSSFFDNEDKSRNCKHEETFNNMIN